MKNSHVHGILHVSEITRSNDKLILSCGELNGYKFAENEKVPFQKEDVEFENVKLILANLGNGKEIKASVDLELWSEGKIVVSNWDEFCKKNKGMLSRGNVNLVFRGWNEGIRCNYLLGGVAEFNELSPLKNPDEEEQVIQELNLARVWQDDHYWTLQWASGKQRLEILVEQGKVQRDYLNVESMYAVHNEMHIVLKNENVFGESCIDLWVYEEGVSGFRFMKGKYAPDLNEIIMDVSQLDGETSRKFRVFPVVMGDMGPVCYYEMKTADILRKKEKEDKSRRIITAMILEHSKLDMALAASFTPGGYLQFTIAGQKQIFTDMCEPLAKSIRIVNNEIIFKCRMSKSKLSLKTISLNLRSKVQKKQYEFLCTTKEHGDYLDIIAKLSLDKVEWEQFYWDIRGVVTYCGIESEIHFRNHSKLKHLYMLLKNQQTFLDDKKYVVYPYMAKSHDFSIGYRARTEQDCWQFVCKEYAALFLYYLLRPYWLSRKIWLVYEKYSITAQDNSFYFFKYCMEKLPLKERKNIYYVIDKKSPDYQYVSQYDSHVIQFLSLKHMIYMKGAQLLVSSDTKAHAYAWRSPVTIYREMLKRNRNAFLQHGVIYYKKCHQGLKKSGTNNCRLFIVSSEVEKQIIKKYFGYKDSEIAVTGLARWDVLHDTSVPGEKMILMMPTWRNWLEEVSEEEFQKSDYYKYYMELLNNPKLHDFLDRKNVTMVFYIHPKFREYIKVFGSSSPHIKMIEFGTQPLNELIMKCNMMVTDYSSACWDVYYQGKPVLFYLFDYELYSQVQGAYIDMRTEAFGAATDDADELIRMMESIEENGFQEEMKYASMRDELLPYRDDNNSERTYRILKEKFTK